MRPLLSTRSFPLLFDLTFAALRIGFGILMLTHGWPKFEQLISGDPIKFSDPIGIGKTPSLMLAVFAEFFCAALVVMGLLTRLAVIPLIVTMVVAVFIVHGNHPIGKQETGLLYLLAFSLIFAHGSGRYSFDRLLGK